MENQKYSVKRQKYYESKEDEKIMLDFLPVDAPTLFFIAFNYVHAHSIGVKSKVTYAVFTCGSLGSITLNVS